MKLFYSLILGVFSLGVQAQELYINEIMARNGSVYADEFLEFDDFVEIYNPGAEIDLAGYYLTDNVSNLMKWLIPDTDPSVTTVPSGGYLLFWCDNMIDQGANHAGFSLTSDGEDIFLVAPDGVTIIDGITFGPQQRDISFGRACDGCDEWVYFNVPTPLATNMQTQLPNQLLFINEVMINNNHPFWLDEFGENDRWFEIYNPNATQVNLAGYFVSVSAGNPLQYQFPSNDPVNTTIPAGGFRIFWGDNSPEQGPQHMNFNLPLQGGTITLRGPDEAVVNAYTYTSMTAGVSYGRSTDGGASSIIFDDPTPRASNTLVVIHPPQLYINELLTINLTGITDFNGDLDDWFEIYNPNDFDVDVAGYYISDNPGNPDKWRVPETSGNLTVIPANGFKLFWADGVPETAHNHASFKLSSVGEWLVLRGPDAFTIIDQISWTQQYADTSFGRFVDGEPEWVLFVETTPEASNNGATINVLEAETPVLHVYPNPVVAGSPVRFDKTVQCDVFSASGRMVKSINNQDYLSTEGMAAGMYILVVDGYYRIKLMVQH